MRWDNLQFKENSIKTLPQQSPKFIEMQSNEAAMVGKLQDSDV